MKTSEILKVNIGQIVNNWSKDFIRADYSDMSDYVYKTADRYATMQFCDKDMTRNKIVEYLRTAFLVPVKVLQSQIKRERSINQFKWVIDELNEAIKYYNQY